MIVGCIGVAIGYGIWHKANNEIIPKLWFKKGGNNELSSTVGGNAKNTITLYASFNKPVWWAGIYLSSGNEDIFEDNYVEYSNDNGLTWISSSGSYDGVGVYFWFNNYRSEGSIRFKLLKPYTEDKLVDFTLTYCPKEHEPYVETEVSAPVLFLTNTISNSEIVKDINFRLFNGSCISKTSLISELDNKLGDLFTTSAPLSSVPAKGEDAAKLLCESINNDGISNAASIAALIACENWFILSSFSPLANTTFDLEISFLYKNNADDYFTFDFSQHWKVNGQDANYDPEFIRNIRYAGAHEKISCSRQTQDFDNSYLTVDRAINNYSGILYTEANRGINLHLITQDLATTIYEGVTNFPTWMFPNP